MNAVVKKQRPKHLDLPKIKLPLPGVVSILHRVTGVVLFLFVIPLALRILQDSFNSSADFNYWVAAGSHPLAKLFLTGFIWAYLHHFFAGLRYLLLDLHVGIDLKAARRSSVLVLAASIGLTLLIGLKLWF